MQTVEIYELVSPPLYCLVLAEPAFSRARTADSTLDAAEAMKGKLPDLDLALAAVQQYATLTGDSMLVDFVAELNAAINRD